jgi:hypothetical protein
MVYWRNGLNRVGQVLAGDQIIVRGRINGVALVVLAFVVAGCNGGSSGGPPPPPSISIKSVAAYYPGDNALKRMPRI